MLDDKTLAELDEAEKKATPGPWHNCGRMLHDNQGQDALLDLGSYGRPASNAQFTTKFIALARNHMRALIDEVAAHRKAKPHSLSEGKRMVVQYKGLIEKLRAELAAARAALDSIHRDLTLDQVFSSSKEAVRIALKRVDESGLLGEKK